MPKIPIKIFLFFIFIFFSNNAYSFNYNSIHEFEIYRNNKKIGFHKLSFQNIEDKLVVNTEIQMIVKLGLIPIFSYFHKGEEIWVDNQFIEVKTSTKKNSREFDFTAKRKGPKIEIKSRGQTFLVDSDTLITSYWHQKWFDKKVLIDSQHGKKRLINVEKKKLERIEGLNQKINAYKYKVTGTQDKPNGKKIDYDIWYDDKGRWVKLSFFVKKSFIEYYLVTKY